MIEKVREAIAEYESNLFYGQAIVEPTDKWNYSVFRRTETTLEDNSSVENYELGVVRENYIDQEEIENIINAILSNTSLKLKKTSIKYEYYYNQKNSVVVEIASIQFYKSSKVCYG